MSTKSATKPTKKAAAKKPTAKAVARKTAVKKPAAKKPTTRTSATKRTASKKSRSAPQPTKDLVYAADHQSFWVTNGAIVNSLRALADALEHMDEEVYQYHALGEQNDFSVWVEQVLCDGDCAAALRVVDHSDSARDVVLQHLTLYRR